MAMLQGARRRMRGIGGTPQRGDYEFMRIPMLSPETILTDRADGTLWLLSFNTTEASSDGLGYITLVAPPPSLPDRGNYRVFGPYDGPIIRWVSTPEAASQGVDPLPYVVARLLVRGGYLGYERVDRGAATQGRTTARVRVRRDAREIIRPTSFVDGDTPFNVLAWRPVEF